MKEEINDAKIKYYLEHNKVLDMNLMYTSAHKHYYSLYRHRSDILEIVPGCKHRELTTKLRTLPYTYTKDLDVKNFKHLIKDIFIKIQKNGIQTKETLEYTKYNIFTRTGRPSNSNNGINYAALNKKDGTRAKYISRFAGGVLAEFDYDAYHLRLIAKLIDYDTPKESFHTHLGKLYFEASTLTSEQYEESKKITFRILYGGIPKELKKIPYFDQVDTFIFKLWDIYKSKGYIETPILKRRFYKNNFEDMTPQKLFNYLIQAYETEMNCIRLRDIFEILEDKESKIILYTYDSFLFDISPNDGKKILKEISKLMKYPTILKIGRDYHNMQGYGI